jgi:NTE family protein
MSQHGSAIVLPAGGARAAYQVGALSFIAKRFPDYRPKIFCGVSAGSINACFLAQGLPFPQSTAELYELWSRLTFEHVLKTQFQTMFRVFLRWGSDLFLSRYTHKLLLRSLLDASPLAVTLVNHIHFSRISRALRNGNILGLSVTATNYKEGKTTVFFDSADPIAEWHREQRVARRTTIRIKHIMASWKYGLSCRRTTELAVSGQSRGGF